MEKEEKRNLIWFGIFAAAMAFTEAMIVYYLRKLYYTGDALFPINASIPSEVIKLEFIREICTVIMLLAVSFMVAKKFKNKFAYFIYAFAVWDIFYYVWLKAILNWPKGILEWDILFLVPIVWASPWIAPVICSILMIVLALLIIIFPKVEIEKKEWIALILSAVAFFISFIWDYTKIWFANRNSQIGLMQAVSTYVPTNYNWLLFTIGVALTGWAISSFMRRAKRRR